MENLELIEVRNIGAGHKQYEPLQFTNNKNERIVVYFSTTQHNRKNRHDLMNLWIKHGYMEKFIPETINMMVYVYDEYDNCTGKYNPTIYPHECKINFDWMLEATSENFNRLLEECKRMANE